MKGSKMCFSKGMYYWDCKCSLSSNQKTENTSDDCFVKLHEIPFEGNDLHNSSMKREFQKYYIVLHLYWWSLITDRTYISLGIGGRQRQAETWSQSSPLHRRAIFSISNVHSSRIYIYRNMWGCAWGPLGEYITLGAILTWSPQVLTASPLH